MTEEWRDVMGYEGLYQVSNEGRVKSLARTVSRSDGLLVSVQEKILKLSPNVVSGHMRVNLRKDYKTETVAVHVLVATHFLKKPTSENVEVCHNDGNAVNNFSWNLRWGTRKSNIEDRRLHGTLVCGEDTISAKLTELQVEEIKRKLLMGERGCDLAREFAISQTTISQIKNNKRWTHV